MKKLIKILLATAIAATITTSAYAVFLANFVVPSTVTITGTPGITVSDSLGVLTALTWGDIQATTQATHIITIANTGQTKVWILDGSVQSLTANPALPTGVSLTWNLASLVGVTNCASNPAGSGITACLPLAPMGQAGSTSTTITLTLAVASNAAPATLSFSTVFNGYSTSLG
jgi:hypothetical protein